MFNLEDAITQWRRHIMGAGINSAEVANELESHLREDIESQICSGMNPQDAFEIAVRRIGPTEAIQAEFTKIGVGRRTILEKLQGLMAWKRFPVPPLQAFNPEARQTLALAHEEAPHLGHNFVGTEHVLLVLLKSETGVVPNILHKIGVDHRNVRTEIENWIRFFPPQPAVARLRYTPRVKKALRLALNEARNLQRPFVGDEHIFLGLILEGDGVAARVLKHLGIRIDQARQEILRS